MSKSSQRKTTRLYQSIAPMRKGLELKWKRFLSEGHIENWEKQTMGLKEVLRPIYKKDSVPFCDKYTDEIAEYNMQAEKLDKLKLTIPGFFRKRLIFF